MSKTVVYKITRLDDKEYIGITTNLKKRLRQHEKSKRFLIGIKNVQILEECDDWKLAREYEEMYISKLNTYRNGLNETINGAGNHLSENFTTKGFKFSDETRKKMAKSFQKRVERDGPLNLHLFITKETYDKWSEKRKGKVWPPRKIDTDLALQIYNMYENDLISFNNSFVKTIVKKSDISKVGVTNLYTLKSPNGKFLTKEKLYCKYFSMKYKVTESCIRRIINKKGLMCESHDKV